LNVGDNSIQVVVTSQDGTKKTYAITIRRDAAPPPSSPALSGNNSLSELGTSTDINPALDLDQAFDPNTLNYTVTVSFGTGVITIAPTVQESHATIKINDIDVASGDAFTWNLMVGDNVFNIVVTAQDGTTKTYKITVTRSGFIAG
jgi:hypothetical protein